MRVARWVEEVHMVASLENKNVLEKNRATRIFVTGGQGLYYP